MSNLGNAGSFLNLLYLIMKGSNMREYWCWVFKPFWALGTLLFYGKLMSQLISKVYPRKMSFYFCPWADWSFADSAGFTEHLDSSLLVQHKLSLLHINIFVYIVVKVSHMLDQMIISWILLKYSNIDYVVLVGFLAL